MRSTSAATTSIHPPPCAYSEIAAWPGNRITVIPPTIAFSAKNSNSVPANPIPNQMAEGSRASFCMNSFTTAKWSASCNSAPPTTPTSRKPGITLGCVRERSVNLPSKSNKSISPARTSSGKANANTNAPAPTELRSGGKKRTTRATVNASKQTNPNATMKNTTVKKRQAPQENTLSWRLRRASKLAPDSWTRLKAALPACCRTPICTDNG